MSVQPVTYAPPPAILTWHGPVCYHAHLTSQTVVGEGTFVQYVITCDDCGATVRWGYNMVPPTLAPQPLGDDGKTLRPVLRGHKAEQQHATGVPAKSAATASHAARPAPPPRAQSPQGGAGATPTPRASRK